MRNQRPLLAIRRECLACCSGSSKEVSLCPITTCALYPLRFGKKSKSKQTTLQAIKQKCRDCGEGTAKAVRECEFIDCALFQYRFGKNPQRKGVGGEGQRFQSKKAC
ncbi:MAG: hypothetical protein GY853_14245 [PVC group bacterium]|nr:hypothetical protein [PVC group bacterium]